MQEVTGHVLVIDDDEALGRLLVQAFSVGGLQVEVRHTCAAGLARARERDFDVIYLDVGLPDGSGLGLIPDLVHLPSRPEIIIMTGAADPHGAELALTNGAWDYIEKSDTLQAMQLPLLRALQYRAELRAAPAVPAPDRAGIIGESAAIRECLGLAMRAALSPAHVLITGETGTGKELLARAIHRNSPRARRALVTVDCAAIPATLIEGALFGHRRGAFTSADRPAEGLVPLANGGTLFLDEIGELPMEGQRALLRVLQEHRFRPLGSNTEEASDFRLISATHRNLHQLTREGTFRDDLLYRLKGVVIEIPPLRARREDIKRIARHHVDACCSAQGIAEKGFSPDFIQALMAWDWPGNVRELLHTLDQVLALAHNESVLFARHLPLPLRVHAAQQNLHGEVEARGEEAPGLAPVPPRPPQTSAPAAAPTAASPAKPIVSPLEPPPDLEQVRQQAVTQAERDYLCQLLQRSGGKVPPACQWAGLSPSQFYTLLRKHGLQPRDFRPRV